MRVVRNHRIEKLWGLPVLYIFGYINMEPEFTTSVAVATPNSTNAMPKLHVVVTMMMAVSTSMVGC